MRNAIRLKPATELRFGGRYGRLELRFNPSQKKDLRPILKRFRDRG